jgi:DNA-binding winged helix-turn-helix (wHTH) protein
MILDIDAALLKTQVFELLKMDGTISKLSSLDTLKILKLSIDIAIMVTEQKQLAISTDNKQENNNIGSIEDNTTIDSSSYPGGLIIVKGSQQVFLNNESISLTLNEFNMLILLVEHAGELVSRETLSEKGIGKKFQDNNRSVDMHISNLRKKLGTDIYGRDLIKSIRGIGYQYVIYIDNLNKIL